MTFPIDNLTIDVDINALASDITDAILDTWESCADIPDTFHEDNFYDDNEEAINEMIEIITKEVGKKLSEDLI